MENIKMKTKFVKDYDGMWASIGYNANNGCYKKSSELKIEKEGYHLGEYWIDFPKDIKNNLFEFTSLSVSWKDRLRFLFKPKKYYT